MPNLCSIPECNKPVVGGGLCRKHYMRLWRKGTTDTFRFDPVKRFWRKVKKTDTCWLWLGPLETTGYGTIAISQRPTRKRLVHRHAYEMLRGPIPADMTIDHLCKVKHCVNPDHMEIVTRSENTKRANPFLEHCKRGHPLSGSNLYFPPSGGARQCRACKSLNAIKQRQLSQC